MNIYENHEEHHENLDHIVIDPKSFPDTSATSDFMTLPVQVIS